MTTLVGSGTTEEETLPDWFVVEKPAIVPAPETPLIARGVERPVKPISNCLMGSLRKGMTRASVEVKVTVEPGTELSPDRLTERPPAVPRNTPLVKVMVK